MVRDFIRLHLCCESPWHAFVDALSPPASSFELCLVNLPADVSHGESPVTRTGQCEPPVGTDSRYPVEFISHPVETKLVIVDLFTSRRESEHELATCA